MVHMITPPNRELNTVKPKASESGQALVFLVLVFIGLLGFVGLAIDGGRIFTERRQGQNTADNAALAAARAKCVNQNLVSAALSVAAANGYDNNGTTNTVTIHNPPTSGQYSGNANVIEVIIDSTIPSSFISLVYTQPIRQTSQAISVCTPGQMGGVGGGNAIMAMNPTEDGTFRRTGAGNVIVSGGGIFVNSKDDRAMEKTGSGDITADSISIVGNINQVGSGSVNPTPTIGALTRTDPLATVPTPSQPGGSCITADYSGSGSATLNPGYYCSINITGSGSYTFNAGLYYIDTEFDVAGSSSMVGNNVMFYCKTGQFNMTGSGGFDVTAPTSGTYAGMLLFMDRANSSQVKITGSTGSSTTGTIYAISSPITLTGSTGTTILHSQVIGNIVEMVGTSDLNVDYNPDDNYKMNTPPTIDLLD